MSPISSARPSRRKRRPDASRAPHAFPKTRQRILRIGAIAQLGERLHGMQEVGGSIPPGSTNLPFEIKGHLFYRPEY